MLSTYTNVFAWHRVHLSINSLRSLFPPLSSSSELNNLLHHQWALFGEITVPAETSLVIGCHVGLLISTYVYLLSIYESLSMLKHFVYLELTTNTVQLASFLLFNNNFIFWLIAG